MAERNRFSLFGFRLGKKDEEENNNLVPVSFTPPAADDGSITVSSSAFLGTTIDQDGTAKNEVELISRYREMSVQPEIESAIEDIVNEAVVQNDEGRNIKLVMDDLDQPEKIKEAIQAEFDNILKLLNFNNMGSDIFRRYYIDGRLFYHVIIDVANPQKGILELRYIDPRKIKKIRELKKSKDPTTGVDIISDVSEYYVYNDKISATSSGTSITGVKIATDSVINVNSGLMDTRRAMVLSYLHKAIKPLNQLRMIEDASIIYKISRAPQRRIFYIDVGNLPKIKAEQYVRDMMTKYKNKLVYDATTGEVRDDRRHLSMLEDFWMPRRSDGGRGTEITTLESSDSFNDMSMVEYFERKLYKSLNVPVTRLNPEQAFNIGRTAEITRDELKFAKFVDKLRNKFSELFDNALRIQLVLKGICTEQEWTEFKESTFFDFIKDNNFTELKEAELMQQRLGLLAVIDPYVGKYYSKEWIRKNVLRLDDEEIKQMEQQIEKEQAEDFQEQQKQIVMQQQLASMQQPEGQEEQQPQEMNPQGQQQNPNAPISPINPYK
jgi:Bacteriophage T4-like portal protein (Gp20)